MCCEHGEDAPAMPREKGIDIKELQDRQYREGVAIVCALREKADWCHNNNGNRTFEDWERMSNWLLGIADRLEYGIGFRREDSMIAIRNKIDWITANSALSNAVAAKLPEIKALVNQALTGYSVGATNDN